jgi:hypothetical protein
MSGPLLSNRGSTLATPTLPFRRRVLTECHIRIQAHLWTGTRYVVIGLLGPECSEWPNWSEYRDPMHDTDMDLEGTFFLVISANKLEGSRIRFPHHFDTTWWTAKQSMHFTH